VNLYQIKVS